MFMLAPNFYAMNLPTHQQFCFVNGIIIKFLSSWITGIKGVHASNFENYCKISFKMWLIILSLMAMREVVEFLTTSQISGFYKYLKSCQCDRPNYCLKLYFFCFWVWSFFMFISHLYFLISSLCPILGVYRGFSLRFRKHVYYW